MTPSKSETAQEAGEENLFLFARPAKQFANNRGWYGPHWHYQLLCDLHADRDGWAKQFSTSPVREILRRADNLPIRGRDLEMQPLPDPLERMTQMEIS